MKKLSFLLLAVFSISFLLFSSFAFSLRDQTAKNQPNGVAAYTALPSRLTSGWVYYGPGTCNNPWDGVKECQAGSLEELELIKTYYSINFGVNFIHVGFLPPPVGFGTCASCNCPRGDTVRAYVSNNDAAKLVSVGWSTQLNGYPSLRLQKS